MYIDVFNGDADGICALHQLRLTDPRPDARLVTGVKRDIRLLQQLENTRNAHITVLDISLDSNRDSLAVLLENDCEVFYVDHHFSGEIPEAENLITHINADPEMCTSLIVNQLLDGKYSEWAVVGAFGDNLHKSAYRTAEALALPESTVAGLKELGELLNYNGYGPAVSDLFFPPQELYRSIIPYSDPLEFLDNSNTIAELRNGFRSDMEQAAAFDPVRETGIGRIFELPPEKWARRVSGVFSNLKAREEPGLAHALLTRNPDDTYRVSVRAPLENRQGADTVCRTFATGGGRAGAAGINSLEPEQLELFFKTFEKVFQAIQAGSSKKPD
jgi:single-stranded DNA-specific DHH superfamily exonuclease